MQLSAQVEQNMSSNWLILQIHNIPKNVINPHTWKETVILAGLKFRFHVYFIMGMQDL